MNHEHNWVSVNQLVISFPSSVFFRVRRLYLRCEFWMISYGLSAEDSSTHGTFRSGSHIEERIHTLLTESMSAWFNNLWHEQNQRADGTIMPLDSWSLLHNPFKLHKNSSSLLIFLRNVLIDSDSSYLGDHCLPRYYSLAEVQKNSQRAQNAKQVSVLSAGGLHRFLDCQP